MAVSNRTRAAKHLSPETNDTILLGGQPVERGVAETSEGFLTTTTNVRLELPRDMATAVAYAMERSDRSCTTITSQELHNRLSTAFKGEKQHDTVCISLYFATVAWKYHLREAIKEEQIVDEYREQFSNALDAIEDNQ